MDNLDYLIFSLYILGILALGIHFRKANNSHEDFFLAGRTMGWLPIGLSVMVTAFSAINYVALPNEVFGYGLYVTVALPVFLLVAWPITQIWMPFFHSMKLTSAYEYLEKRFDKNVRSLASLLFIFWRLFWMATALYAASKIMHQVTKLPLVTLIIAAGVIATLYTSIGGMKAVMWTDVAQFFVLFGGIVIGLYFSTRSSSFGEIFDIARDAGKLRPFLPFDEDFLSISPHMRITLWSGLIGVSVAFLSRYGADQVVMQRYFSAKSLKAAQRGFWFNSVVAVFSLLLLVIFGLAIYAHAVKSGALNDINWETLSAMKRKGIAMKQLASIISSFPPGITGLIASGLLAATMSSIDSGINSCSAAYISDIQPRLRKSANVKKWQQDRLLTVLLGIFSTSLALALIPLIGQTNSLFMIVNKVVNGLGSPLLTLFVLGMFSKKVNAPGMIAGAIIGLIVSLYVTFAVKGLSLHYYAVLSLLGTITPCIAFSFLAHLLGFRQNIDKLAWTWKNRTNP